MKHSAKIYNEFTHGEFINALTSFIPDETIKCKPPYIKGKKDLCWIKFRKGQRPKTKNEFEQLLGIRIQ